MNKKKIMSLIMALVMLVGVFSPLTALAAEGKTEKVTVHKLLAKEGKTMQDIQNALKDKYVGSDKYKEDDQDKNISDLYAETATEIDKVYFAWQNADGQWIDEEGKVVDSVDKAMGGLTTTGGKEFDTSKLPQDKATKYKIVEVREKSTYGTAEGKTLSGMLAVPVEITLPLVNEKGTVKEAHVYPKNTETGKPDVDKKEDENNKDVPKTDGKVTMGEQVPYVVTTTIKAGSTYKHVAWNDRMSDGLTFDENVTIATEPELNLEKETDYTLKYEDNGFVLQLTNSGLKKLGKQTAPTGDPVYQIDDEDIVGKNQEVKFTLKYTATVNEEAIVDNALENTVTFHYGNKPGFKPLPGDRNPEPQTGKTEIKVDKSFVSGDDMATTETWPADLKINLKLEEYNPETNTWKEQAVQTAELNSGKTSHTFENLDKEKTYRVVEADVDGWVPNYSVDQDGNLVIKNRKNDNPNPITPKEVIVRTGGKKFVKTNADGTERLAGAEFIVGRNIEGTKTYLALKDNVTTTEEKTAYENAEKAYIDAVNAWNEAVEKNNAKKAEEKKGDEEITVNIGGTEFTGKTAVENKIAELKTARDNAFGAMKMQWKWVPKEDDAFTFTTNEQGQWEVKGLKYADNTYFFKETKAPKGYAENKNEVGFNISAGSYTGLGDIKYVADAKSETKDAKQIVNKKVTIPQTGGMGTVLFTIVGISL
ncbi:MAG: isopeptide-forming domain-containing fimbrial protein, partial [Intestinibacter bartlettii]